MRLPIQANDFLLQPNVIQVWAAWLNLPRTSLMKCELMLSADERERAGRFVFDRDRQSYMVARGILRQLIGRYVGLPPEMLNFAYNKQGKPFLNAECGGEWLNFNLAHSNQLALYAFCSGGVVGVDVECMRDVVDMKQVAASTFSTAENIAWQKVPMSQRSEAFFNCWTRKEAFIKAVGLGLSYPLGDFDVTLHPDKTPQFLRIEGETVCQWGLVDLRPADGFIGAVAAPLPAFEVQLRWWDKQNVRRTFNSGE
jgi:4'-phosphopantetheinyl transferase